MTKPARPYTPARKTVRATGGKRRDAARGRARHAPAPATAEQPADAVRNPGQYVLPDIDGRSARELVSRAGPYWRPSFMAETNGGGRLEQVAGFNVTSAITEGFASQRVPAKLRVRGLRRAADLAFVQPQSGCGDHDPAHIPDTTVLPWKSICHLIIERADGSEEIGTGWFCGPSTVITAGHCVYRHGLGYARNITVIPGRSGNAAPFGMFESGHMEASPGWISSQARGADFGAIFLDSTIGSRLGWFGLAALTDARLEGLLVNNAGFPDDDDKPLGSMWFNGGRIVGVEPALLQYRLDTEAGQSGSPVFFKDADDHRIVVAIHAYGGCPNRGVRITASTYRQIQHWSDDA